MKNIFVVPILMDGGLAPGELRVVIAPAGIGKSWLNVLKIDN